MIQCTIIRRDMIDHNYRPGSRGYKYDVLLGDKIICTSIDPQYAACRALVKLGYKGGVEFYRSGKPEPDTFIRDLEKGAKLCTIENSTNVPYLGRYEKFDRSRVESPESKP